MHRFIVFSKLAEAKTKISSKDSASYENYDYI